MRPWVEHALPVEYSFLPAGQMQLLVVGSKVKLLGWNLALERLWVVVLINWNER